MAGGGRREPAIFGSFMIARNFKNWQGMNHRAEGEAKEIRRSCGNRFRASRTSGVLGEWGCDRFGIGSGFGGPRNYDQALFGWSSALKMR